MKKKFLIKKYDKKYIWKIILIKEIIWIKKIFKSHSCRKQYSKVKLATVVEGNQKVPFSIATKPRCRGGRYSFPWIAPLYPWYVPYIAEC